MYNPLKCRPDYWRTMEPATGRSSTMINDDPIKTYINIYIYGAFNWMVLNHDEWWWRSDQKIEKCLRLVFWDHDCCIGYDFGQPQPWRWHSSHLGSCLKIQNCPKVQNRTWISESKHKIGCDRALKKIIPFYPQAKEHRRLQGSRSRVPLILTGRQSFCFRKQIEFQLAPTFLLLKTNWDKRLVDVPSHYDAYETLKSVLFQVNAVQETSHFRIGRNVTVSHFLHPKCPNQIS